MYFIDVGRLINSIAKGNFYITLPSARDLPWVVELMKLYGLSFPDPWVEELVAEKQIRLFVEFKTDERRTHPRQLASSMRAQANLIANFLRILRREGVTLDDPVFCSPEEEGEEADIERHWYVVNLDDCRSKARLMTRKEIITAARAYQRKVRSKTVPKKRG